MKLHLLTFLIILTFEVVKSKPEINDLRCSSTNVESYNCTWTIGPNDNITYYSVSYGDDYSPDVKVCPKPRSLIQNENGKRLTCLFHKDKIGSVHSQTVKVRATDSNDQTSMKTIEFYPRNEAQTNPPVNIQFPTITSTRITITWQKPQDVINYKNLLIYQLEYRKENTEIWKKPLNINNLKEETFTLTSLEEYTAYEIRLASKIVDTRLWSNWSPIHKAKTIPGVPGIVRNMSAIPSPSKDSLILQWKYPSKPNGPIDYFSVGSQLNSQGWFFQNTTNTKIEIPLDCENVTEGRLTTSVAAVNVVDSTRLKGEWLSGEYDVCDIQYVTILPTVLPQYSAMKVLNITLISIIVPSLVILILVVVKIIIKRYSKLDLRGSPNVYRRHSLKQEYHPTPEEEHFDELRTPRKHSISSYTYNCEHSYDTIDVPYSAVGVACHSKLALNTNVTHTDQQVPESKIKLESETEIENESQLSTDCFQDSKENTPTVNADYVLAQHCQRDKIKNSDISREKYCTTACKPAESNKMLGEANGYLPHDKVISGLNTVAGTPPHWPITNQNSKHMYNAQGYVPHTTNSFNS